MSEIMRPMSFEQLLNWTLTEYKENGTVFGERHPYHADSKFNRTIFGRDLETPIGPAAGPTIGRFFRNDSIFEISDRSFPKDLSFSKDLFPFILPPALDLSEEPDSK